MEFLRAFLCGGIFCAIGQILIDKTRLTPARILVGYVVAGFTDGSLPASLGAGLLVMVATMFILRARAERRPAA